jgi:hypothetical protein
MDDLLQTKLSLDGICVRPDSRYGSKRALLLVEPCSGGDDRNRADFRVHLRIHRVSTGAYRQAREQLAV